MKEKYIATVTYANGTFYSAIVSAKDRSEAWKKLLEKFGSGALRSVTVDGPVIPTHEIK